MRSRQSGFSLVEMMLAQALALFLIIGLIQIYLTVEKTFHVQQAIMQMQENGRFAVHFLREHILIAGNANCDSSKSFVNTDLAIKGYAHELPVFLRGKVAKNTAVVVIGHCETQDNITSFKQRAFFIGATSRKNKSGKTTYALYEMPIGNNKRELVSDISDMQISYGVATEDGKNILEYLPADAVLNWKKIKSVSIALLLDSEFPILSKPEPYRFAGKIFSKDRFLHREWDVYITLREFS